MWAVGLCLSPFCSATNYNSLQTVEVTWSFKTKRKEGKKKIVVDEPVLSGAVYGTLRAKTGKPMKLG